MKHPTFTSLVQTTLSLVCVSLLGGCGVRGSTGAGDGAPPHAIVEHEGEDSAIRVDHPERFPLATAAAHDTAPSLTVTGVVGPDVSRSVPVVSLTSGRVIAVQARLGDQVQKGQPLLRIQSADVSAALSDYKKARADQALTQSQLDRANDLFSRGAIAKKDLEVAEDAATKATVDVENSAERLRLLGGDPHPASLPTGVVDVVAPVSGVITEQNVTTAAGVKTLDNSPNLFTISDLSHVWILCDVFENDFPTLRVGDAAEIHLAAYPDRVLTGRINNIGPILDPSIRAAKVRVEVANPGILRIGMFVTAVFRGRKTQTRATVPATAVLHMHDRDWVYLPIESGAFTRQEVVSGDMLPGNMQEVISGLQPGQRVVSNALVFQNTVEQ